MPIKNYFIFFALFFFTEGSANSLSERYARDFVLVYDKQAFSAAIHSGGKPSPLLQWLNFRNRKPKNEKLVAALLAFPFPCGIVGLHRIYLGCAPYVPVVYIGSMGGAFGLLPLIDFFVLVTTKDLTEYVNNKKVFMWVD